MCCWVRGGASGLGEACCNRLASDGAYVVVADIDHIKTPLTLGVHVCAAKAGVNMIVKVLAMEWGSAGIRVNAICPGPIDGTEGVEPMAPTDADKARWLAGTALRRFGTTADIANAALYLSSDAASFVTGAILDCDGGMSLGDASGHYLVKERS